MAYHELKMSLVRQVRDNDCWICCAVMVHNLYFPDDKMNYDKYNTPKEIQQYLAGKKWTIDHEGSAADLLFVVDSLQVPTDDLPLPKFKDIQDAIQAGVPMLCHMEDTETGEGHWVVLKGWTDDKKLVFLDPGEKKQVLMPYVKGSYQYADTTAVIRSTTYVDKIINT